MFLHLITFIAMSMNATKSLNTFWRDGPMVMISPIYLGYITSVSLKFANFYINSVHFISEKNQHVMVKPSDWSWHLWQLLEISIPIGTSLSGCFYFAFKYVQPESYIMTEWKLAISREYLNISSQDYLTIHMEEVLDFSLFMIPSLLNLLVGYLMVNGPLTEKVFES